MPSTELQCQNVLAGQVPHETTGESSSLKELAFVLPCIFGHDPVEAG